MMEDLPQQTPSPESSGGPLMSLRTRLILANTIIIVLAIVGMGYYVFFRAQQSDSYLTSQLDASVLQQAKASLASASTDQATTLDSFFSSVRKDITNVGTTSGNLLSREQAFSGGAYWDASKSLSRLPNGSWDNANSDPASVFIPAKVDLNDTLTSELDALKQLDFVGPAVLQANPDAVAIYFGGVSGETLYYPNVDLASVVPPDFDVTQRPWFIKAAPTENPSRKPVWSDPYLDAALHGLVITSSYPVFDSKGAFRGVIAMDIQLNRITNIVSSIHIGETGYAFVVDKDGRLIAMPAEGYKDLGISASALPLGDVVDPAKFGNKLPADFASLLANMGAGQSGLDTISVGGVQRFVVYRPIPEVGYSLAIVVPSQELLAGSASAKQQLSVSETDTLQVSLVLVAGILLLAVLATLAIGSTLTSPLQALTETAQEITGGNLNAEAKITGADEIGTLAMTLNTMTRTLRELIQSLERRVQDRTAALEVASASAGRRASQFEAITQVTRAISSIRNVNELMPLVASVISEYFGFYHVGIFLNDDSSQNVYLIAANSEGGRRMLGRGHRLKIGEQGIVGYVAGRGEARVARNVGNDIVFFNNPDLPLTKSEAALPLRGGGRIIGVLDVQSTKEDAFSQDDLNILAILADQVSLAIENTRLFETTRRSLMEAETLYRQYVRDAWNQVPHDEHVSGFRYSPRGAAPLDEKTKLTVDEVAGQKDQSDAPAPLTMPIKLRGEIIGNLIVRAPQNRQWSPDQIDLVRAVAERVALSAENARLFDETSKRAERERLVTEITSRIRSTNDPEEMIQTALEELRTALGATQVQVIPQVVSASQQDSGAGISQAQAESGHVIRRGNGANS